MNLDEEQKAMVRGWITEGLKLSEIQTRMSETLNLNLTYMEVRFIVDDLGLMPKDQERKMDPDSAVLAGGNEGKEAERTRGEDLGEENASFESPFAEKTGAGGGVSVSVDQVTRVGALASGQVTFSDGKGASWTLDQLGRLGLSPSEEGYKPSQDDLLAFQMQLQNKL